jgi:PAS domain S-box-containing protein
MSIQTNKEIERIEALEQFQILDTPTEQDFDDIVALASQICEVPVATITFLDKTRSWIKAKVGVEYNSIPIEISFCNLGLNSTEPLIIDDCSNHPIYSKNSMVTMSNGFQFYTGIPVVTENGITIGFLSVLDHQPRILSEQQLKNLIILGNQVHTLLKLRLKINKLKQAEEIAVKNAQLASNIFDNAIDAIVILNKDCEILKWNPAAEKLFGWTSEEAIGNYLHEVIIPEKLEKAYLSTLNNLNLANGNQINKHTIEIEAVSKTQNPIFITMGISPSKTDEELQYNCYIKDISIERSVTRNLNKQKHFYETVLNNIPTDIAVVDNNHRYLFINPGAIKNDELRKFAIGKTDFEYFEQTGRSTELAKFRHEKFKEAKATLKEIEWEDTVPALDGTKKIKLRRLFPVSDENNDLSIVIGYGLDITERKSLEIKQTELVKQLSFQNTQLVDFCNIVSHNLRAPLVNMSMLVTFIETCEDLEEQKELISKLSPVIDNLHSSFNELVESIQIKQDLEIQSTNINMQEMLDKIISGFSIEFSKYSIQLTTQFEQADTINFPAKYMNSILNNLISNAIKYRSSERQLCINISTQKKGKKTILEVADNGLGIDLKKHGHNMFKIGKVFHKTQHSKGFGLFMTKTQIEALGGTIDVTSEPDKGTSFTITFINQQ